jgi:3-phosphoshikimate 1-carboxyvinyltransferase
VRVPGDKSISHRALICAALASGPSKLRGVLDSGDVRSTAAALGAWGAAIPPLGPDLVVNGQGRDGLRAATCDLDCGNSGTTARLLAGVGAASPFVSRFVGDASLSRRPMRRVALPLAAMGAAIELTGGEHLPMTIRGGTLTSIRWRTDTPSAQVKSAILLAALVAGVEVTVEEPARSRDHTERMLGALGAAVEARGTSVSLRPPDRLAPLELIVPGDPSSAAFFVALALLADAGEIAVADICLNVTRTGYYRAVRDMGADLAMSLGEPRGGEPVGTVRARPSELRGLVVEERDVPSMIDELPILACVAARADGETVIRGAGELRVKESDRVSVVVENLRAIGVDAEELPDGMRIVGGRARLRGRVRTCGDHRIAMAFGVLAALPGNEIALDDPACVEVSYPRFWHDLRNAIA